MGKWRWTGKEMLNDLQILAIPALTGSLGLLGNISGNNLGNAAISPTAW